MNKIKVITVCILFAVACPSALRADKIYMSDGKVIEGTAEKQGNKYIIKTSVGDVLTVKEDKVLYISKPSTEPVKPVDPVTTTNPASRPAFPPVLPPITPPVNPVTNPGTEIGAGNIPTTHLDTSRLFLSRPFSPLSCMMPEAAVLYLMRNRGGKITPGSQTERMIQRYRELAHDDKRRYHDQWRTQDASIRQREKFLEVLDEAEKFHKKGYPRYSSRTRKLSPKEKQEMIANRVKAHAKFKEAANYWPDSLLRSFLMGAAAYASEKYPEAFKHYETCIKHAPFISCFQQGYAMSLMKMQRYDEAMLAYIRMVELRHDPRRALPIVAKALKDVPGEVIRSEAFAQAKEMLASFGAAAKPRTSSSYRTSREYWMFPGVDLAATLDSIPAPPADRLIFRQGIGVPVSDSTLLVSGDVLKNAVEVMIYTGEKKFIASYYKKSSSRTNEVMNRFGLVSTGRYCFVPLTISSDTDLAGKALRAFGTNVFAEMGRRVRSLPFTIKEMDEKSGAVLPDNLLLSGEGGSPVLTASGELAGFVTGKVDPTSDKQQSKFYSAAALGDLLKYAERASAYAKRTAPEGQEKPVLEHKTFYVIAISGEKFQKEK